MDWIRSHPYTASIAGACILVVIGMVFVWKGAVQPASIGISTWNGNPGTIINPDTTTYTPPNTIQPATTPVSQQNYATATLPYKPIATNTAATVGPSANSSFDYDTLLAEIEGQSGKSGTKSSGTVTTTGTSSSVNAWSFIPSGYISTSSPLSGRTIAQQSLFLYGNEIGSYVEGYDAEHSNQTQVLTDANNDRHNIAKQAAVEQIGQDLETIGSGIAETTGIPASAVAANTALANSYTEIGKDMVAVGQAEGLSDTELVKAIETYDTAVNKFNKSYVALASLFAANGVTFSSGDPGSVFSFTSTSNGL